MCKEGQLAKYILQVETGTITFESTKTDVKNVDINHHRSGKDLCPVTVWALLVLCILQYPGTNIHAHVNTILENGDITQLTSFEIMQHIWRTVNFIGVLTLGFTGSECGTHSIQLIMAM